MATKKKAKQPKPRTQAKKVARPKPKAKPAQTQKAKPAARKPLKAAPSPTRATASVPALRGRRSPIQSSLQPSGGLLRNIPPLSGASPTNGGIRYLTVQDLVELHRAVSVEFGGTQAQPGVVESQFGLLNAVQRPQVTTLGREAYETFPEKVAAFVFALLSYRPFHGGNRRLALASMFAFVELNNKSIDSRVLDEKSAETLFKRAAGHREMGIPPENAFREFREMMTRAIVAQ